MGRPSTFAWALETNYPAGANLWNSQPLKLQPAGDYFTPNTHPSPEEMNYILNQLAQVDGSVNDWAGTVAPDNWQAAGNITGSNDRFDCEPVWCPGVNQWLVITRNSSTHAVSVWTNNGLTADTWNQIGNTVAFGADVTVCHVCEDPVQTNLFYFVINDAASFGLGHIKVYKCDVNGANTWSNVATFGVSATNVDAKMCVFNTNVVVAIAEATGLTGGVAYSTNNGSTWTFASTTMPWSFPLQLRQNATTVMVLGKQSNAGTTGPAVARTLDGINWTFATGFSGNVPASATNYGLGLSYGSDNTGPAWFMAWESSGPTLFHLVRSVDGVSWTVVPGTRGDASHVIQSQTSLGSLIVQSTQVGGVNEVQVSADGGLTFWLTQCVVTGTTGYINSSPNQLAISSPTLVRLSACQGVPAKQVF